MKTSPHRNIFRTRFAKDIVAEVMFPERQTGKIAIIAIGLPSSPSKSKVLRFLATQGYVAIFPRYRGTWESEGNFLEHSPAKDIEDVIADLVKQRSVRNLATNEQKSVRVSAVHLFGGSFGGPAVLMNSHLPIVKKVIVLSPVLDWSAEGKDEPFDFFVRFSRKAFGGAFRPRHQKDWQKLIKTDFYNPVAHTSRIDGSKAFIIHSKDDTIVPYDPVIPFAQKTNASYYLKPTGGHLGTNVITRKFYWDKIRAFLRS